MVINTIFDDNLRVGISLNHILIQVSEVLRPPKMVLDGVSDPLIEMATDEKRQLGYGT